MFAVTSSNKWSFIILAFATVIAFYILIEKETINLPSFVRGKRGDDDNDTKLIMDGDDENENEKSHDNFKKNHNNNTIITRHDLPSILYEKRLYSNSDFETNEFGTIPTFWNETKRCSMVMTSPGISEEVCSPLWGPCYLPKEDNNKKVQWNEKTLQRYNTGNDEKFDYLRGINTQEYGKTKNQVDGLCRPGFLIIGQGKCGTSSLYHYLTAHPRVLPASQKQIHYFKYYYAKGMRWYLSHFPTTMSYLAHGGLLTGEASPGYLPYPDVVARTAREMPGTRIICLGRDPLDRSYSSYRYNYLNPALEQMKKGKVKDIPRDMTDDYYINNHLYTFEDMMRAELKTLNKCLEPKIGFGEVATRQAWGDKAWAKDIYARREKAGLPGLIDLDGRCYGDFINATVPKAQWEELVREKPGKFLNVRNLHLSQAMIGRSLYVYPLEWWYEIFPAEDIYFLCTEEMKDMSGEPIAQMATQFLGLPPYNFSSIVQEGAYNVGGHKGYDKVTSWDVVHEEKNESSSINESNDSSKENDVVNSSSNEKIDESIPLSAEFKTEVLEFFKVHNERLFNVIGRRCVSWATAS